MKIFSLLISTLILVSCNFNSRLYDSNFNSKNSANTPVEDPIPIGTDLELVDFVVSEVNDGVATLVVTTNQAASGVITYTVDGKQEVINIEIDDSLTTSAQTIKLPPGAHDVVVNLENDNGAVSGDLTIDVEEEPAILKLEDFSVTTLADGVATLNVTTNQAASGTIKYTVDGKEEIIDINIDDSLSTSEQTIKLPAGSHNIVVDLDNENGEVSGDLTVLVEEEPTVTPLKINAFGPIPGKTTDSSTILKVRANQVSEGFIYYTQNAVEKKVPVALTDSDNLVKHVKIEDLEAGEVYDFRVELENDNGVDKAESVVKIKETPTAPTLKITQLRVKQIEGDKVTIITSANEPSTGNICVGKQCKKVVYNKKNGLTQEVTFNVAEGDTAARLGIKSKKDTDKGAIKIKLKDMEPKAVKMINGQLTPQDYFDCPSFNKATMKIVKLNAGGDDSFTGRLGTNQFSAHAEFVSSTIDSMKKKFGYEYVQGQFDKQVAKNEMITFAQFDLADINKIECVVAKVKGKQVDQWWSTDTISFYASKAGENDFNKVKLAPSMRYSTKTIADYDWMASTGKVFMKFLSINKASTIKALNKSKHLKFVYEDDSVLDYLELYIVHAK